MPKDLTIVLQDQPGQLARLGAATGAADVNLSGLAAFTGEGNGIVHVLVEDEAVERCRRALDRAGMAIADERDVLVVDIEDRPGSLGELMRELADANVNIDLAYTTFGGVRLVIASDDLAVARGILR